MEQGWREREETSQLRRDERNWCGCSCVCGYVGVHVCMRVCVGKTCITFNNMHNVTHFHCRGPSSTLAHIATDVGVVCVGVAQAGLSL